MTLLGDRKKWCFLAVVLVTCCSLTTAAVLDDDETSYNYWSSYRPPRPGRSAVVHRALGAVDQMMELYDDATGRWQATEPWWLPDNSPWWQSGNALQALLDFVYRVAADNADDDGIIDEEYYVENAMNTIRIQREPLPWWIEGGGEFRASSTDDTGWWALALCRLYDLTGNTTYLEIAEIGAEYMRSYWDDVCGGGIWWDVDPLRYKTAISNTLLMKVQVSLHNRIPNDQMYLELALETWNWFNQSGMINEEYLINDRLNDITCENNNDTTWTYNQGVVLGALAELYLATGNMEYIVAARSIADAVVASPDLSLNGILTEPCEVAGTCNLDQASFKGIFTRNLAELNDLLDDSPYESYLRTQAVSLYVNGRNATDFYGLSWKGPFINSTFSISTQVSAVSLLTAVISKSNSSSTVPQSSSTITLSPPTLRYTPWSLLDENTRNTATTVLGYNETLWNYPGTAAVETMEWDALTGPQQNAAAALNLAEDTWNCYQNHYTGFDWTQLATNNVQVYWAILGWTAAIWESDNPEVQPAALFKAWNALTPLEQAAAQDLCFRNYTWGNAAVPLTEWPAQQDVNETFIPTVSPVTDENDIPGGTNSSTATPTILVPTTSPSLVPETPGPTLDPSMIEPTSAVEPSMGSANDTDTLNPTDARNDGSFEPTVLPTDLPTTLFTSRSNDLSWAGIVYKIAAVLFIDLVCMLDG